MLSCFPVSAKKVKQKTRNFQHEYARSALTPNRRQSDEERNAGHGTRGGSPWRANIGVSVGTYKTSFLRVV